MHIIKKNPALVWLDSLGSPVSIRNYTSTLNTLCSYMDNKDLYTYQWSKIDYTKIIELRRFLYDKSAAIGSINTYLSVIKSVCREAWRLGLISTDCHLKIQDVTRARGEQNLVGKALTVKELRVLTNYGVDSNNPKELRDSAMLILAYGAGLRRCEIVSLNKSDFQEDFIRVTGKGRTQRIIYLPKPVIKVLNTYLKVVNNCSVLFPRMYSGGHTMNQRLNPASMINIIERRCENTGVSRFTPHDLRRSYATNLINSGVDLFTVKELMRHKSLETTQRYDMRLDLVRKKAIEKLPF
jgi:integrase/recombinase XerD